MPKSLRKTLNQLLSPFDIYMIGTKLSKIPGALSKFGKIQT
jgi:hypothetical protein